MRVETNPDHAKARAFFERVLSGEISHRPENVHVLAIIHIVDSAIAFVPALDAKFNLRAFLGKPSSVRDNARNFLQAAVPNREYELNKREFRSDPSKVIEEVFPRQAGSEDHYVIILDIGGYFVPDGSIESLLRVRDSLSELGYTLVGIVEDTQNGHKRYESALAKSVDNIDFGVYSVAQSPLKKPENHLVGVAVTFSIEAILRQSNVVLQSRVAGVIGFGPIGRSVAHALRARGIPVSICEIDPIKLAQAAAQGFRVYKYETQFDEFCRPLNLIVSATGAGANRANYKTPINGGTARYIRDGTFVASVTSSDDEIDIPSLKDHGYRATNVSYNPDVAKWVASGSDGRGFFLMLEGNAVNFKHEGVIGPAIQLLQGEILACMVELLSTSGDSSGGTVVQSLSDNDRARLANMWLDQYLVDDDFRY